MVYDSEEESLLQGYSEMASDETRESEAQEWIEGLIDYFDDAPRSDGGNANDKSTAEG